MGIMLDLSSLALRQVAGGALTALGLSAPEAVVKFLTDHFTNHSQKLNSALQTANERAWKSLEVALAGDSLWERCKGVLSKSEDKAFRQQVKAFLKECPLSNLGADQQPMLQQALQELRSARSRGALTDGELAPDQLAQQAGAFAHYSDPQAILDAEWGVVRRVADSLRDSCPNLHRVLAVRTDPNILVVGVRYYFRREVETDDELFRGLTFARLEGLQAAQEKAFEALNKVLVKQAQQLETRLCDIARLVGKIAEQTEDTNARVRNLEAQIQKLLEQMQLKNREVRPSDSLSVRSDGERQRVQHLVAEYRGLPQ